MTRPPWCFLLALTIAWLLGLVLGFYGAWSLSPLVGACLGALGAGLDWVRWGWLSRGGE